jgi:drug/metabolite transporter (DMT)-like permease
MCKTAHELIFLDGTLKPVSSAPTWALLAGAAMWGVLWYPYRLLAHAGLDGAWSTVLTYGLTLVAGVAIFPRAAASLVRTRAPALMLLMGAAIGWSNLAYVLAVLDGEVMRVLLLFYLAPLWTVPIARVVLGERLDAAGVGVMALAFGGAMVMLWKPEIGLPWPQARAEWLGLAAGFLFALGNVLVRRLQELGDAAKSIAIWAGVLAAGLVHLPMSSMGAGAALEVAAAQAATIAGIAIALVAMGLALQYGLTRLPANRAVVILLFELVVAALAAYLLAGETLRPQDWIGGALIIAASIASGFSLPVGGGPARG